MAKICSSFSDACSRQCSRLVPYPDTTFAYSTPRSLSIRDWRVGVGSLVLKFGIFCYIIIYQVIFQQVYRRDSVISVSMRTRTLQGSPDYNWVNGQAPYCLGVTTPSHPSDLYTSWYTDGLTPTTYRYSGPGGTAQNFPRRQCTYLDEGDAVPLEESDRSFLLTETRITPQRWNVANSACLTGTGPCTPCPSQLLTTPGCEFSPNNNNNNASVTTRSYIPDIEFFTLNIDHSFVAPQANGLTKTSTVMQGQLLDKNGKKMDPCVAYTSLNLPCPQDRNNPGPLVRVGVRGLVDIMPLRALMLAAGVQSLDQISEGIESMRTNGLVLILDISYTNYALGNIPSPQAGGEPLGGVGQFFIFTEDEVQYTYRVFTVPNTQFQFQTATNIDSGSINPTTAATIRFFRRNYGVRLLITYGGRIGSFFFQTLLVNLVAGLALLGVSSTVLEFIVFSLCPLRGLYKQLKDRDTVSITELREAGKANPKEYTALIESFNNASSNNIDAHPEQVLRVLGAKGDKDGKTVVQDNVLHSAATPSVAWGEVEAGDKSAAK